MIYKESSFLSKKPNFKTYTPTNINPTDGGPEYMPMTMQLLLKIETNLKLNLIDNDGHSMISEYGESGSKETHFMLVESITDRYELNWKVIKKVFNRFRNPSLQFEDWVLVDFDNCLKGNPIVVEETN
jgi:hypothetical protein